MSNSLRSSLRTTGLWDETGSQVNISRSGTPSGSTFDIPQLNPATQNSYTDKRNSLEVPSLKRASSIQEEDEPPPPIPVPTVSNGVVMRRESRPPSMRPATYAAVQKHTSGAYNIDSTDGQKEDKTAELEATILSLRSTVEHLEKKLDNYVETQTELQTYRVNNMGNGQDTLGTLGKASAISAPAMHMPKAFHGPGFTYGSNPYNYHNTMRSTRSEFPGTMSSRSGRGMFSLGVDLSKSTEKLKDWDDLENDRSVDWSRDENETRGNYTWRTDSIFSLFAYTFGIAHILRFPYLFYKYGGAIFLVPYIIMLVLFGMPVVFLELALGQYSSNGILSCWDFAPMVQGVGWGMFIFSILIAVYYNTFAAWAAYYLGMTFTSSPVPWSSCQPEWGMQDCFTQIKLTCQELMSDVNNTLAPHMQYFNQTYGDSSMLCPTDKNGTLTSEAESKEFLVPGAGFVLPAQAFFTKEILDLSPRVENLDGLRWEIIVAFAAVWIIVFLCMIRGVKSFAKSAYVTVIGPYVMMIILLGYMGSQRGGLDGIKEFFNPIVTRLEEPEAWRDAGLQVGLTLMTGMGGLITLGSYNRFHYDSFKDVWIVVVFNIVTSLLLGMLVFACVGVVVQNTELNVYLSIEQMGPGFVFIIMSEAIAKITDEPVSKFMAFLTFVMFILFVIGTQCGIVETIITGIFDKWPITRKRKSTVRFCMCIAFFVVGLIFCTRGGMYVVYLLEHHIFNWPCFFLAFCECGSLMWVYNWRGFSHDIRLMYGKRPWIYWAAMWVALTPLILGFIVIFLWVSWTGTEYKPTMLLYPAYADIIGIILAVAIIVPVPLFIIIAFCQAEGSLKERWYQVSRPKTSWGPALLKHRVLVRHIQDFVIDPWTKSQSLDTLVHPPKKNKRKVLNMNKI